MLTPQLPLNIHPQEQMTFANYLAGQDTFAIESLQTFAGGKGEQYIYIWGEIGRSHLMQACCHKAQAISRSAQYLPLAEIIHYSPEILEGLECFDIVCLDDVHLIAGKQAWEEAIFHLYNRLQQAKHQLLVSANVPPAQLTLHLPDLRSRLSAGLILQLHDLADEDKIKVLQIHAKQRGLELSNEVGLYLLKRHSRYLGALLTVLDQLDIASLAAQRRLTIPFVKKVLENN